MSPLATQLLLWTMLAVDIAIFWLARRSAARGSILPTSPRLRAVARELAGPLACALLIVPIFSYRLFAPRRSQADRRRRADPGDAVAPRRRGWSRGRRQAGVDERRAAAIAGANPRADGSRATDASSSSRSSARARGSRCRVQPVQQAEHWMLGITAPQQFPRRPQPGRGDRWKREASIHRNSGVRRRPRQRRRERADARRLSPTRSSVRAPGDELPPLRVDAVLSLLARLGVEIGFFAGLIAALTASCALQEIAGPKPVSRQAECAQEPAAPGDDPRRR